MQVEGRQVTIRRLTEVALAGQLLWLAFIALAYGLLLDGPGGWRGRLGPLLIALTGVAQILSAGILAIGFFAGLFFVAGNEPEGHYGLVQRLVLVAGMAWIVALALGLLDLYGRGRFLGSVRKTTSQMGDETP